MTHLLYMLGIITIPFTDISGFRALGEMQHELSAYLFLAAIVSAGASIATRNPSSGGLVMAITSVPILNRICLLFLLIIFLSFVTNFHHIIDGYFRERYSIVKFATSTMVVFYGFAIAYLTFFLSGTKDWHKLIVRPIAISAVIVVIIAGIEYFAWEIGAVKGLYDAMSSFIHAGSNASVNLGDVGGGTFGWGISEGRLRSVAFEPPSFANYAGLAWPWILAGCISQRGASRLFYVILLSSITLCIILASSRTGMLLLVSNAAIFMLLKVIYLTRTSRGLGKPLYIALFMTAIIAITFAAFNINDLISYTISGDSISNISRLASNTSGFNMFLDNPVWGLGFGQYGFHAVDYMPQWGWYSWEIRSWFFNPMTVWPPVFSMYVRFAAELGIVGVLFWIGLWLWMAWAVTRLTTSYNAIEKVFPWMAYPLIISCISILISGIPSETLRVPMIWITLGLCCRYIHDVSKKISGR